MYGIHLLPLVAFTPSAPLAPNCEYAAAPQRHRTLRPGVSEVIFAVHVTGLSPPEICDVASHARPEANTRPVMPFTGTVVTHFAPSKVVVAVVASGSKVICPSG